MNGYKFASFLLSAVMLFAMPSMAFALEVTCKDDTGECTVSEFDVDCTCKGGASDGFGSGGGTGGNMSKEELEKKCQDELKFTCGDGDTDDGEFVTCENDDGSCKQYADFVSCSCKGGVNGAVDGGGTGGTGGDGPLPTKAEMEASCKSNLELFCSGSPDPADPVTCSTKQGSCSVTESSHNCKCADGSGSGSSAGSSGSATTAGTTGSSEPDPSDGQDTGGSTDGGGTGDTGGSGSGNTDGGAGGGTDGPTMTKEELEQKCQDELQEACGKVDTSYDYECKSDLGSCGINAEFFSCDCKEMGFKAGDHEEKMPSTKEDGQKLCESFLKDWCDPESVTTGAGTAGTSGGDDGEATDGGSDGSGTDGGSNTNSDSGDGEPGLTDGGSTGGNADSTNNTSDESKSKSSSGCSISTMPSVSALFLVSLLFVMLLLGRRQTD